MTARAGPARGPFDAGETRDAVDDRHTHTHDHPPNSRIGGGQECVLCPVCVLLQALSTARPEVMEHLLAAGKELTLAVQALVEAQAEGHRRGDDGLQRIDVE